MSEEMCHEFPEGCVIDCIGPIIPLLMRIHLFYVHPSPFFPFQSKECHFSFGEAETHLVSLCPLA